MRRAVYDYTVYKLNIIVTALQSLLSTPLELRNMRPGTVVQENGIHQATPLRLQQEMT